MKPMLIVIANGVKFNITSKVAIKKHNPPKDIIYIFYPFKLYVPSPGYAPRTMGYKSIVILI